MSKFHIFNVQLLTKDHEHGDVGGSGYKRLMAALKSINKEHIKNKTLDVFHEELHTDIFFGFKNSNVGRGFVYGYFSKYTRTNKVSDLNRGRVVFQNTGNNTTVSKETLIPFVFDTNKHHLAIDNSVGISEEILLNSLVRFFSAAKGDNFPHHQLHINLVSSPSDVAEVLAKATSYKKIAFDVTFLNNQSSGNSFLRELRETRTQRFKAEASGGDGEISSMPAFLKEMVSAAAIAGSLYMTYYIPGTKAKQTFDSSNSPLTFIIRKTQKDDDERFFSRVHEQLQKTLKEAGLGEDNERLTENETTHQVKDDKKSDSL